MGKMVVIKNVGECTVKFKVDDIGESECLMSECDIRNMFTRTIKEVLEGSGLECVEVMGMTVVSKVEELN